MMVLMMVVTFFVCDQCEDCLHQVKVINPSYQNQHLVNVVRSFLVI